jgi:hypothetical protein
MSKQKDKNKQTSLRIAKPKLRRNNWKATRRLIGVSLVLTPPRIVLAFKVLLKARVDLLLLKSHLLFHVTDLSCEIRVMEARLEQTKILRLLERLLQTSRLLALNQSRLLNSKLGTTLNNRQALTGKQALAIPAQVCTQGLATLAYLLRHTGKLL